MSNDGKRTISLTPKTRKYAATNSKIYLINPIKKEENKEIGREF